MIDKNIPKLDDDVALEMLGNILDACGAEEVTVPLEVLTSYGRYRKNRYLLQKVIIIIMFIIFCILPFLFVPPAFDVHVNDEGDNAHDPIVELQVHSSVVPVRNVLAYMGNQYIPVYETEHHVYSIRPCMNGTLHVTVTLSNGQQNTADIEITNVDIETPHIMSNYQENHRIHILVDDGENSSGIDYEGIYSIASNGSRVYPSSYDASIGDVVFDYPEYPLNIYVPDYAGNILHLVLTLN